MILVSTATSTSCNDIRKQYSESCSCTGPSTPRCAKISKQYSECSCTDISAVDRKVGRRWDIVPQKIAKITHKFYPFVNKNR